VELEQSLAEFEAQGLSVAAVSYDTREILAHFATRMGGLHYPLLADPDSTIIRAFGVINRNVPEDNAAYGMARPGTFIVDAAGVVKSKYFEPGHRQRFTAETVLVREFGVGGGSRMRIDTDHFRMNAYPSQSVARRGNRVTLVMEIELPPKMHLYAPGVEGYKPVSVTVADNPSLRVHETTFPEPEILQLAAIQERVPVYQNSVRILQDVTISPRMPGWDTEDTTTLTIPTTFRYQACDDKVCFLPAELPVAFELEVIPHDGDRVPDEIQHKAKTSSRLRQGFGVPRPLRERRRGVDE